MKESQKKEIDWDLLTRSIKARTGSLSVKNIRIEKRFEENGVDYTQFLYDTPYNTDQRCIYDDNWCC